MLRYIIVALLGLSLVAALIIWVITGGPRKLVATSGDAFERAQPDEAGFKLPWQPIEIFPTIDITDALNFDTESPTSDPQERLSELESEYASLKGEAERQRVFGSASPFAGKVTIVNDASGLRAEDVAQEYLQIQATYTNTAPIDINGWILESALSGTRVSIPPAAAPHVAHGANALAPVSLPPGALAIVASPPSPIGISFRENICTGYLGQFQEFNPPLRDECPSPGSLMLLSQENLERYGGECVDVVQNLSQCRFPDALPADISGSCRAYLTEFLSYTGCVNQNRNLNDFQKNMWRVFLGSRTDLWRNSHDAIRLLDAEGKTVSVYVY